MTELRWGASDLSSKMPPTTKTYLRKLFTGPQVAVSRSTDMRPLGVMGDEDYIIWEPARLDVDVEGPIDP